MRQTEVTPLNAFVGRRIADLRKYRGLSQEELSKLVGVSRTTIVSWETGKSGVDVTALSKLTKALQAKADYFLGLGDFSLAGKLPAECLDEEDMGYFTYFSIFANDFTERQKQLYLANMKAFTEIVFTDAKAVILNRLLSDMASDEEYNSLYSIDELQACLQKYYGLSINLRDTAKVKEIIEDVKAAGRRCRDKDLIDTVKTAIFGEGFHEEYPETLKKDIEEELQELGNLLFQEGCSLGEAIEIDEQNQRLEAAQDAFDEEMDLEAEAFKRDWYSTFADIPSREDFEAGLNEGRKSV